MTKGAIIQAIEDMRDAVNQCYMYDLIRPDRAKLERSIVALQSLKDAVPDIMSVFDKEDAERYNSSCARLLTDAIKGE